MYAYMHANSSEVCLPIAKSHKYGTSTRHSRLRFCVIMHVNIIETTTIGCIKHETFRIETIVVKLKNKIIFATGNLKYLLWRSIAAYKFVKLPISHNQFE
jgi:hypothetical protein